jgi:hypothetical protein
VQTSLSSESWSADRAFSESSGSTNPPIVFHLLLAGCLVMMVLMARYSYQYYALTSQEDHEVEWATVVLYLSAAAVAINYAVQHRHVFDGLVALFCLFNGGEEFSWGQRLLGFSPPKYFLEANVQQEVTFHNFFGSSVHNLLFSLIVVGYFVLLPLLTRYARGRKLMAKVGATSPPIAFSPWALLLSGIYIVYPIHLSSEWMETILAGLFLAATAFSGGKKLTSRKILIGVSLVFLASVILSRISNAQEKVGTPERVACAEAEVRNLLDDMLRGGATTEKFELFTLTTHKRIFVAGNRGYLNADHFKGFISTRCVGSATENAELRHRYAIDPWGLSYWVLIKPLPDGSRSLTVYSFGPDRRRDSDAGTQSGDSIDNDDISATGILPGTNNQGETNDESSVPVFSVEP